MTFYLSSADTGFVQTCVRSVVSSAAAWNRGRGLTVLSKNCYSAVAEVGIYIAPASCQQGFSYGEVVEVHLGALSKGHEVTA